MKTTLVTGASGGIGEEFARQLAACGNNLLLVARSEDRLAKLAKELADKHNITAQYIAVDLIQKNAPRDLFAETERRRLEVDLLINNAGFGSLGDFTSFNAERDEEMITLNITALVLLTHLYLPLMRARRAGAIINVASTAAFQPVPYMATYAATKAFVLSFSEALAEENRGHNVKVMALCPGATDTNFFQAAEGERPPYRMMQTPQAVVEIALRALDKGQSHVISGWSNYFVTQAERLIPRRFVTRIAGKAMRPFSEKTAGDN